MNGFPLFRYRHAHEFIYDYMEALAEACGSVNSLSFKQAGEVLREAYRRGAHVFTCGNGGSASIANHLACDHVKGIGTGTDLAPRVMSLASNAELLTAIANDLSYEDVFARQLRAYASHGDVLIAISSSGNSANICKALNWANDNGLHTIALTGFEGGVAHQQAQAGLYVDSRNYGIVEDAHQAIMHALAQFIRQAELPQGTSIADTVF